MSVTLSELDANRGVASPDIKSEPLSLKGVLATSLDEMLSYQASRRLSMASSGRANFNYASPKSSPSSRRSQRSQHSNRTQRGRSGSPGFITVDGTNPLKTGSVIKVQCPVVVENDLPAKIETPGKITTPVASKYMTEIKAESSADSDTVSIKLENTSVSDHGSKAEDFCAPAEAPKTKSITPEDAKKQVAAASDATSVKSESLVTSHHDVKVESPSASGQNLMTESPSTSEDSKKNTAVDSNVVRVKSETLSTSDRDVNSENSCASGKALMAESPVPENVHKNINVDSDAATVKSESDSISHIKAKSPSPASQNHEAESPTFEDVNNDIAADPDAVSIKSDILSPEDAEKKITSAPDTVTANHVNLDLNTESPCASVEGPKAETHIPEDIKKDIPTSPEATSVKSEGTIVSVHVKADIPVVSNNDSTITAKEELPITKVETPVSNDSEPKSEIKVKSKEIPVVTPSVKVHVVSYHLNADTHVRVRNDSQIGYEFYHVRKDTVSAASDVLEKKFSTFSSTDDIGDVVHMMDEDDCPVGLNIVFSLLHHKYHELPNRLSIPSLYGLAQVVEKYQLRHLLVPFADKWLVQDLNYGVIMAGDKLNNERVMLLTWIFGEGRWFSRTFPKVAKEATLVNGVLMGADGPFAGRYPPELIDIMTRHRHECLQKLRQSIDQPLQDLIKGSRVYCRSKDANAEVKEACTCQQLGSMISGLTTSSLIPFPDPKTYKGSVMDLVHKLEKLRPMRYKVPGVSPHLDTHQMCGIRHLDAVNKMAAEPIRLTAQLFNDFKRRGEMTGVFSKELYNEVRVARPTAWVAPLPAFKEDRGHFAHEGWVETMQDNWMKEEERNTTH